MITSIPLSAIKLGIDFKGYEKLAQNIGRMKLLSSTKKQQILERADEKLPTKISPLARKLIKDMEYDREVFSLAGLPYSAGPPKGQKLFTTALADYLLRNFDSSKLD